MRPPHAKLPRKQEQAIAALLMAPTIQQAAHAAAISEPTLARWLKREDFQAAYRAARREAMQQAIGHVQQVSGEAVQTLRAVMLDGDAPASARVTAARCILSWR